MTRSVKEGLLAPAFWALIVRKLKLSPGRGRASVRLAGGFRSDWGMVGISVALLEI